MATFEKNNSRLSVALDRTGSWVLNQQFPSDVVVQVGERCFNLHKFMLVAKSNYIRKLIVDSKKADLTRIDLSNIPGGAETFEKAAKYCYGVNFEITVHNVAALRCAAEYLQMSDDYCDNNLISRTNNFLEQVALSSLSGAIAVLKSCEELLPMAEDLQIVPRCIDSISFKVYKEANFSSTSPPNWWTEELSVLNVMLFGKIINAMRKRGAKASSIGSALVTYAERSLQDLVRDHSGRGTRDFDIGVSEAGSKEREILESLVALSPADKSCFPVNFLCCLLRCAIFLKASTKCKNELEKRISVILEHVTVDDLLIVSFTYDGERLFDLDSVRRIISGFVEKEKNMAVFNGGDFREVFSAAMQRVVKTVDSYLGEIAIYGELSISKFNGIANLVPKGARKIDDDLYRAIDIYLKAHPNLDEIEREKVCSIMDPLKLSHEARLHASKNKRLPVQIVLHALYYDQLKLRSSANDHHIQNTAATRSPLIRDVSLVKENEALRSELTMMKMYISDMQKNQGATSTPKVNSRTKSSLFSSMSKTLGKLNPFRSKDTSNIEDIVDITKPRRRRFSIS